MIGRVSILIVTLSGTFLYAPSSGQAQNPSGVEERVRLLDGEMRAAVLRRDTVALHRLWSEQLVVNAPNNQVVVGKRAVLDDFMRTGIIDFSSFEREIEFTQHEGDFVITMGMEIVIPNRDSPSNGLVAGQQVRRRFTNIWKREGDAWRLFIRHANVMPNSR